MSAIVYEEHARLRPWGARILPQESRLPAGRECSRKNWKLSVGVLGARRTRTRIYGRVSACYRFRSTLRNGVLVRAAPCAVFTLEALPLFPSNPRGHPPSRHLPEWQRESVCARRKKGWISRHVSARATHLHRLSACTCALRASHPRPGCK